MYSFVSTVDGIPLPPQFTGLQHTKYSRDLQWSHLQNLQLPVDLIPSDLNYFANLTSGKGGFNGRNPCRIRQGKRASVRQRLRKQHRCRIPPPSMILYNAQSLRNKTDMLQAQRLPSVLPPWLSQRHDCQKEISGQRQLCCTRVPRPRCRCDCCVACGGVCLYVNERYVLVRERLCTKDVELLSVSLRPPYLPSEFPKYSSQWYTSIPGQTWIKLRSCTASNSKTEVHITLRFCFNPR